MLSESLQACSLPLSMHMRGMLAGAKPVESEGPPTQEPAAPLGAGP